VPPGTVCHNCSRVTATRWHRPMGRRVSHGADGDRDRQRRSRPVGGGDRDRRGRSV